MTDYIDREALLKAISKVGGSPLSEWDTVGVVSLVANQPAADVAPVRRGKWGCYEPLSDGYRCSSCKLTHRNCTAYCPNCGAKMEVQNEYPG